MGRAWSWEGMGLAGTSVPLHKGPGSPGPVVLCSSCSLYPLSWGTWRARLSIVPSQAWLSWHPSRACQAWGSWQSWQAGVALR